MLDHTSSPRIYIACLASYNNGVLHGEWIDAEDDADTMQEQVNRILRASPYPNVLVECPMCEALRDAGATGNGCSRCKGTGTVPSAEEFAIHDFDGLPSTMGEHCGLDAVAGVVAFYETCENDHSLNADEVRALLDEFQGDVSQAESALDEYVGTFDTFKDYADETADEMIACHTSDGTAPQFLINYFDYDSFARDLEHDMTVINTHTGVMIFHA
jgi:antirestriction protein